MWGWNQRGTGANLGEGFRHAGDAADARELDIPIDRVARSKERRH